MRRFLFAVLATLAVLPAMASEEVTGRADLFLLAPLQNRTLVAARMAFADHGAVCPSDSGTITMSRGVVTLHRVARAGAQAAAFEPADDDAYSYRIAGEDCQLDLTVRLMTQRAGQWEALLLPKIHRPSLSDEERGKLQAQLMERLRERIRDAQAVPPPDGGLGLKTALDERFAAGQLVDGAEIVNDSIEFEDAPAGCADMVGTYVADRSSITFSFLANLSGDLNRFLIERIDESPTVRRLQLTRHGCRLDIAVAKSVRRGGFWLPVAAAPRREQEGATK